MASNISSALTAGMPQITASTARRWTVRVARSEALSPASRFNSVCGPMTPPGSLDLDDVVGLPGLIEKRFERTIETDECEPALSARRLNPVFRRAGITI